MSGDLKYYLGDYANSMYLTGGLTYAQQQGYPSETYFRAGAGWEFATQGNVVYVPTEGGIPLIRSLGGGS